MLEQSLFTLVRSTLVAGLTARGAGYAGTVVRQVFQPSTVGTPSAPQITMQTIGNRRYGPPRRDAVQPYVDPVDDGGGPGPGPGGPGPGPGPGPGGPPTVLPDMVNRFTQWWETTIQIGATSRRNPTDPDFLTLPSANDICKAASDILQQDAGLTALAVQRVRPLRITDVRNVQFVNESDQYEAMPSFDITLVYPQVLDSATPPVITVEPDFGRV